MGSVGQVVGGGVGLVVGGFFGQAQLGFVLGMGLGGLLDPPKNKTQDSQIQIQDLQFNTFHRNLPVPVVYGLCRIAGNLMWLGNNRTEIVEREVGGGKGSPEPPKQKEVWYYADFAVGLSEGPIGAVPKVFLDDQDISTQEGLSYVSYLGTTVESADATVAANLGANAPAFRNTAYLRFSGRLGRANRIPAVTAEVQGRSLAAEGFSDDFNRVDAAQLGTAWTEHGVATGVWNILSQQAHIVSLSTLGWARVMTTSSVFRPAKNMRVSFKPRGFLSLQGVQGRVQPSTEQAYGLILDRQTASNTGQNRLSLIRFTGPNAFVTLVGCVGASFQDGSLLTLVLSETNISAEVNGVPVFSPVSDSTITSIGFAGLVCQTDSMYLDDFSVGLATSAKSLSGLFSDSFNRADATDLGSMWQHEPIEAASFWGIQGNAARRDAPAFSREWVVNGAFNIDPDVEASAKIVDLESNASAPSSGRLVGRGVQIRVQNSSHLAYIGTFDALNILGTKSGYVVQIGRVVSPNSQGQGITTIACRALPQTGLSSPVSGDRLVLKAVGTTLTLLINSGELLSVSDSIIQSAGTTGLFFNTEGSGGSPGLLDDFEVKALGNLGMTGKLTSVFTGGNPALAVKDILTNARYGLGLSATRVNLESFDSEAAYCDELVDNPDGTKEKRFVLDHVLDRQSPILDHIREMVSTFRGLLIWSNGQAKLKIEKAETVSQSFHMGSIIADSFTWAKLSYRNRPNVVRVEYINAADKFRHDFVEAFDDWDIDTTGDRRDKTIQLLGVKRVTQASRMAQYYLNQAIQIQHMCTFRVGIAALKAEVGDVIAVSHDVPAWVSKQFRIVRIEETENDEMLLSCLEYNASIYTDAALPSQASIAGTIDPTAVPYQLIRLSPYKRPTENQVEVAFVRANSGDLFAGSLMYRQRGAGDFEQQEGTALALAPIAYLDPLITSLALVQSGSPLVFTDGFDRTDADSMGGNWRELGQTLWRVASFTLQRGDPSSGAGPTATALALTSSQVFSGDAFVRASAYSVDGLGIRPRVGLVARWQEAGSSGQYYYLDYGTRTLSHSLLELRLYRVTSGEVVSLLSATAIPSGQYFTTPASAVEMGLSATSFTLEGRLNNSVWVSAVDSWVTGGGAGGLARLQRVRGYPDVVRADSPIAYYRLGESSGTTLVADWSGQGLFGSYTNVVSWEQSGGLLDDADRAVYFTGSPNLVSSAFALLPGSLSLPLDTAVTVELIAKVISADVMTSAAFTLGNLDNPNRCMAHIPWEDFILYWDFGSSAGSGRISTPYSSYVGTYTHIALVSGGNSGTFRAIYLNGSLVASLSGSDGPDTVTSGGFIAKWTIGSGLSYRGVVDEFAIYTRILSSSTILDHYRAAIGSGSLHTTQGEKWDDFAVGSGTIPLSLQILPAGWGAALFDTTSVFNAQAILTGGTGRLVPAGTQPFSGFLQIFRTTSLSDPAPEGRFPTSGYTRFRSGDVYKYTVTEDFVTHTQTHIPLYSPKGGFANIGSARIEAEQAGYTTFADTRLEGVIRGGGGTTATSHTNIATLGAFIVESGGGLLDRTSAARDISSNTDFFAPQSSYLYLGASSKFSLARFFLAREASTVVSVAYEYSTGDGAWASATASGFLAPTDQTSGFRKSGDMLFEPWGNWNPTNRVSSGGATLGDGSSRYFLRLTRTSATLSVTPQEMRVWLAGETLVTVMKPNAYVYDVRTADTGQVLTFKALAVGVRQQLVDGTQSPLRAIQL